MINSLLMITRTLVIVLFFLSAVVSLKAQNATVYLNNGQTKMIQLNYSYWLEGKISDVSTKDAFSVDEVKMLDFDSKIYETHNVALTTIQLDLLTEKSVVETRDTLVYLQKVIGGTMDLFAYIDDSDLSHYFIRKDGEFYELIKEKLSDGEKTVIRDKYKGILKIQMQDCSAIELLKIDKISFSDKSFRKLVSQYNEECGDLNYTAGKSNYYIDFGILAAYAFQNSKFSGVSEQAFADYFLLREEFNLNSFQFGGFVKFPIAWKKAQVSAIVHAYYSSHIQIDDSVITPRSTFSDTISELYVLDMRNFEYGILLNKDFVLAQKQSSFSIGAGISFVNILSKKENDYTRIRARRPFYYEEFNGTVLPDFGLPSNILLYNIRLAYNFSGLSAGINARFGNGGYITNNKVESFSAIALDLRYGF